MTNATGNLPQIQTEPPPPNLDFVSGSKVGTEGRRCPRRNEEKCVENEGRWDVRSTIKGKGKEREIHYSRR